MQAALIWILQTLLFPIVHLVMFLGLITGIVTIIFSAEETEEKIRRAVTAALPLVTLAYVSVSSIDRISFLSDVINFNRYLTWIGFIVVGYVLLEMFRTCNSDSDENWKAIVSIFSFSVVLCVLVYCYALARVSTTRWISYGLFVGTSLHIILRGAPFIIAKRNSYEGIQTSSTNKRGAY